MRISIVYQPKRLKSINADGSGANKGQQRREIARIGAVKGAQIALPCVAGVLRIGGAPTESWGVLINQQQIRHHSGMPAIAIYEWVYRDQAMAEARDDFIESVGTVG
jgi:hypothetical protein